MEGKRLGQAPNSKGRDGFGEARLKPWDAAVKAVFDRVMASAMLLLLTPVLVTCALVVKCVDPRSPAIDRLPRFDRKGREFELRNFRVPTLPPVRWAIERLGLRHLPELVNVMRGEMSLVGPRPLAVQSAPLVGSTIRPGMTGLWVLEPAAERTPQQIAELTHSYASSWSLATDIDILVRSAGAVRYGPNSSLRDRD